MRTNLLILPTVQAAVEAFQNVDKAAWNRLFAPKAELYDDGSPRDLKRYTEEAIGRERFLSIDRVANDGLYIEGEFHSDQAGTYRCYFNFELTHSGRIRRLDVGRAEDVVA
jgi:hypothetical protein